MISSSLADVVLQIMMPFSSLPLEIFFKKASAACVSRTTYITLQRNGIYYKHDHRRIRFNVLRVNAHSLGITLIPIHVLMHVTNRNINFINLHICINEAKCCPSFACHSPALNFSECDRFVCK